MPVGHCVRCDSTEGDLDATGVCALCRSRPKHSDTQGEVATALNLPSADRPFARTATDRVAYNPTKTINVRIEPALPTQQQRELTFANYELHEGIGEGGMGIVFRATQRVANRVVALKVMSTAMEFDQRLRQRFQGEAESLAKSRHPGIVEIYEVGEENGRPFFSMEYCPGGSLAKAVRTGGRPTAKRSAGLVAAVARAVHAAHLVGVIHRDLKPGNILLAADGSPKVADFGLAVLADRDSRLTSSGALLGTPSYCAPEQAVGKKAAIDARTDVWALGATLYDLLTGQPPFKADSSMATAVKVLNDPVVPPRQFNPSISPVLEAVCLKCLEKNPAKRYPTAAAVAEDLENWAADKPTTATPRTSGQQVWAAVHRHRGRVATLVGFVLLAVILISSKPFSHGAPKKTPLEIQRVELDKGNKVTLIGETGLPPYAEWKLGQVQFDLTPTSEGVTAFQTAQFSLLELCPDPRWDRYQFQVDFKHLESNAPTSLVGAYIGYTTAGRYEQQNYRCLWVELDDKKNPAVKPSDAVKIGLTPFDFISVQSASISNNRIPLGRTFPVVPVGNNAASWRTVQFKVSLDGVDIFWLEKGKEPILTSRVSFKQIAEAENVHRENFAPRMILPPEIPVWSTRGGLGVYGNKAAVAFRNATLTPIVE
ncbi:MAG TPA: serine/threonine-protein kinase [Fimbriiglobus sp.]|jgi:serine/threonine-protein kinase